MINVEVKSAAVLSRSGISSKTGKAFSFFEQKAEAEMLDPESGELRWISIVLSLKSADAAYPVGVYRLAPSSFYVDRWSKLSLKSSFDLEPAF